MDALRAEKLKGNYKKIFWMKALTQIRIINGVMSIFYLHRGIQLSDIFILGFAFTAASSLAEIPSSYLADKWGRKKTLVLGTLLSLSYWIVYFFSHSLEAFILGSVLYGAAIAMYSGTDQALMYDTSEELGDKQQGKRIGQLFAANRLFKIFAPLLAVLIAKDLTEGQFQLIIAIDMIGAILAVFFALSLCEANHKADVQKMEAGIMHDAVKILKNNAAAFRGMMSKTLLFLSTLMVWHYFQEFYHGQGVPLLAIGIGWSIFGAIGFVSNSWLTPKLEEEQMHGFINGMRWLTLLLFAGVISLYYSPYAPIWMYALFVAAFASQGVCYPVYARYMNLQFRSYNRSTSISLSNFLKGFLDPLLLLLTAYLIDLNIIYPYFLTCVIMFGVLLFLKLPPAKTNSV